MWTTQDGVAIFRELSSDAHFTMIFGNSILHRNDFAQQLAQVLQSNPPARHTHYIKKIVISGAVAFEYGAVETVTKTGQTIKIEAVNVFFREKSGWKFAMSLPAPELKKLLQE